MTVRYVVEALDGTPYSVVAMYDNRGCLTLDPHSAFSFDIFDGSRRQTFVLPDAPDPTTFLTVH